MSGILQLIGIVIVLLLSLAFPYFFLGVLAYFVLQHFIDEAKEAEENTSNQPTQPTQS
jgi:phage shock protein PspC (stress-responsive transcriptional regulator)